MTIKDKLIKAMVESSANTVNGYAYGPACTFKTKDEVLKAENQLKEEFDFSDIGANEEITLDF